MLTIEQTSVGMLVFLECGCAALRGITHPTGAAALVHLVRPYDTHAGDTALLRSVPSGELVSPYVRTPVDLNP